MADTTFSPANTTLRQLAPTVVEPFDRALRPTRLAEYVGQRDLKAQLKVYLAAANMRAEALDHTLLFGPPGLGKTTLAQIMANELGSSCLTTSGPVLEKPGDLAALLSQLRARDVLFIDEIHRLPAHVAEILYPAMEDFKLDIVVGEGASVRTIQLPLEPFTLVGATTRAGALSAPLRDRFGITARMEYYDTDELAQILCRSAGLLNLPAESEALGTLAQRSRGTPRIANRLLRRVRDFATVAGSEELTLEHSLRALDCLGVDAAGLDAVDRRFIEVLAESYNGGPVGLDTLAAATGDSKETLEDAVEPYLMQQGFLQRTPRGRMLTPKCLAYRAQQPAGSAE